MKQTYIVTDMAGERVAGVRKPVDGKITLTAAQAAQPLRLGHITLAHVEQPKKSKRNGRR